MKLAGKVLYFFVNFLLIFLVNCNDCKFLKMDNCTSSNEKVAIIESCTNTQSSINVTFVVKQPMNNIDVSDRRMIFKCFELFHFCFAHRLIIMHS